jgi:hypothetical protein
MLRYLLVAFVMLSAGTALNYARADIVMTLNPNDPVDPRGFVRLDSPLLGGYSGDTFYAGVMNWTETNPSQSVYTYCIDVASVIDANVPYHFSAPAQVGLASGNGSGITWTTNIVNAVKSLWNDPVSSKYGQVGIGVNLPVDAQNTVVQNDIGAAEFQVALWDIIYDGGLQVTTPPPAGSTQVAFNSLNPGDLTTAFNWANQAYADGATYALATNVQTLTADPTGSSQNQAMYLFLGSTGNQSSTPLPPSLSGGLVLLGIVATQKWAARRRVRVGVGGASAGRGG